jgi:hypothetical protein
MITKWRLNTRAVIKDGNLGRGADTLQGKDIILEVFSKGTAATGWEEVESRHTDSDGVSLMRLCCLFTITSAVVEETCFCILPLVSESLRRVFS